MMCPPHVDQTTRTAQTWQLEAPREKQVHLLRQSEYSSLSITGALFVPNPYFNIYSLLAQPVISPNTSQSLSAITSHGPTPSSGFHKLSNEILDMILDYLQPDKNSLMSLALTSSFLWSTILQSIHTSFSKHTAPWSNTPLIFHGNYSTTLPKSLVEEGLLDEIVPPGTFSIYRNQVRTFFWNIRNFKSHPVDIQEEASQWLEAFDAKIPFASSAIPSSSEISIHLRAQIDINLFPTNDQIWVLRNLTKKQYLTSHSLAGRTRKLRKSPEEEQLRFEDVLMMKIHWTSIVSHYEQGTVSGQGSWAGDCFDLVLEEVHRAEVFGEYEGGEKGKAKGKGKSEWLDVGDAVFREAVALRREILVRRK